MFLSGVIWTKSFELFAHQRGRKSPCLVLLGVAVGGLVFFSCFFFFFKSPPVFFFYCANTFLLHRQAGMLTHKPCKELKLARADGKKNIVLKFLQKKKKSFK